MGAAKSRGWPLTPLLGAKAVIFESDRHTCGKATQQRRSVPNLEAASGLQTISHSECTVDAAASTGGRDSSSESIDMWTSDFGLDQVVRRS